MTDLTDNLATIVNNAFTSAEIDAAIATAEIVCGVSDGDSVKKDEALTYVALKILRNGVIEEQALTNPNLLSQIVKDPMNFIDQFVRDRLTEDNSNTNYSQAIKFKTPSTSLDPYNSVS